GSRGRGAVSPSTPVRVVACGWPRSRPAMPGRTRRRRRKAASLGCQEQKTFTNRDPHHVLTGAIGGVAGFLTGRSSSRVTASGVLETPFRGRPLTNRLALMIDVDWRDGGFRQRRPSAETLAWVAASMGRGSRIVGYRRLTGGVCSAVNRLTVERRGMRTFVVLRQYPGGLGLQGSLEKEIANLGVVARSGLPVPGILATDVAGASTGGAPSLLMTRLPGHVHLNPAEPRSGMTRIAEIAVLLHSLDLPAKMFRPWTDSWIAPLDELQVPVDAQKPAVWKAAFGVMAAPPPTDTAVFLHGDLLPVNMLWSRG